MKRIVRLITIMLVCAALACNVFADTFVPSVSYKDAPEIDGATMGGENIADCLVVTSINDAKDASTDILQQERDLLLDVYGQLSDGSMKLPLEDEDYVIRDLVDVSFKNSACVEPGHNHKEGLAQTGTAVTVSFDLGVKSSAEIIVMVYVDGQWTPAESVTNNGDGTVTCVFEEICPVAFCVEDDAEPPYTGDHGDRMLLLWFAVMVASLSAIVVLLLQRRKHSR